MASKESQSNGKRRGSVLWDTGLVLKSGLRTQSRELRGGPEEEERSEAAELRMALW